MRFIAIASIAIPLFILGWIGIIELLQIGLERELRENLTVSINLSKEMKSEDGAFLAQRLTNHPYIKEARYISPDEALKELQEELGEDPKQVLGYNPLVPSIELHLNAEYAYADSLPRVDAYIASLDGVDQLSYRSEMFGIVDKRMSRVSLAMAIFSILLLIMAIIQINNTTHIMIYTKRFLIRSMTLLGASFSLIRKPFLWYSVANGIWASLLANLLIFGSLWAYEVNSSSSILPYLSMQYLIIDAVAVLLVGILISLITAFFATRRYIRMDGSRMVLS